MLYRPTTPINGKPAGALRAILETACAKTGVRLDDLTVLSPQVDPYRLDTLAGHRDGRWIAEHLDRLVPRSKKIHWRGLHYTLVSTSNLIKPNGQPYLNTDDDWTWLVNTAGKTARWLGYVSFDRIIDQRNSPPIIHRKARVMPKATISVGVDVEIPDNVDMEPRPVARGFEPRQPYCFAIFGEKASLEDVLDPIATAKHADLYLPTGEISDALLYQIAKDANEDGRPLVMFTVADCDPAGRQMSVSIGRKLQAFRDLRFPKFRFEVVPVALTIEQVQELGLPSTPLKETEKRADRWREEWGIEQTEIDALATLRPNVLRQITEDAFVPYFDDTLADRVEAAEVAWMEQAQAAIDAQVNPATLAAVREEATAKLAELRSVIDDLNERMDLATDGFDLPEIDVPQPEIDEDAPRQSLSVLRRQLGGGNARIEGPQAVRERSGLMSAGNYTCPMPSGLPPRSVAPSARSARHHRRYAACNAWPLPAQGPSRCWPPGHTRRSRHFSEIQREEEVMTRDIYQEVTSGIVAELKTGARPWIKPWSETPGLNIPANAVSGRPYSGVNTLLLWTARRNGWPQPRFLTFKQALEAGGHVRKGEHGHHIVFVKDLVKRETEGDEPHGFRMLKSYTVFNVDQCEGLPTRLTAPPRPPNPDQRDALIDQFIAATGVRIHESDIEDTAGYCGGTLDLVNMPAFKFFRSRAHYYATLFHELVHWTGHPSRLDRQLGTRFGLQSKAAEELIAELGAAFLCAEFSIDGFIPHAAYIENYLELLQNDSKAIFTAASKAQAAVDFLRQRILAESVARNDQHALREARYA